MPAPTATLTPLPQSDGSATYSAHGYTVLASVNGPLEPQRRDELPEEAFIEVNIRPAVGVGGTQERHLETLLHRTLRSILLISTFPRSLVQVTLQVLRIPEDASTSGGGLVGATALPLLPALLQAGMLALLDASLPLRTTYTSTLVAVTKQGQGLVVAPSPKEMGLAESLHVFAFSGAGEMLLVESAGIFNVQAWEAACEKAEAVCCGDGGGEDRMEEGDDEEEGLKGWVKEVMKGKVERDLRWKEAV